MYVYVLPLYLFSCVIKHSEICLVIIEESNKRLYFVTKVRKIRGAKLY